MKPMSNWLEHAIEAEKEFFETASEAEINDALEAANIKAYEDYDESAWDVDINAAPSSRTPEPPLGRSE